MPTYDYQCKNCEHKMEVFQNITEKPLLECPRCSQPCLERGIGGGSATFNFKGKGFYITDYPKTGSDCGCQSTHTCSRPSPKGGEKQ